MSHLYQVLLINQVRGGVVPEKARHDLASRVQLSQSQLEKVLSSSSYAVLKTDKIELANKTVRMIESCGFVAELITPNVGSGGLCTPPQKPAWGSESGSVTALQTIAERVYAHSLRWLKGVRQSVLVTVLLTLALLSWFLTTPLMNRPTLEDAADHALDHILFSGNPVAPDLLTRFARSEIRVCFAEKAPNWKPAYYSPYVEALSQAHQLQQQGGTLYPFTVELEREQPALAPLIEAALTCPEKFIYGK